MKRSALKLIGPLLAVTLIATACGGGGGEGDGRNPATDITKIRESDAGDVKAPERVDAKDFGLAGMILSTNSETWRKQLDAPSGRGVVVLYVQPNGPADKLPIGPGDLITEVAGKRVSNAEYALTLLRGQKGDTRKIKLTGKNGKEREPEIKLDVPHATPLAFLNGNIKASPNDAIFLYLRGIQGGRKVVDVAADLQKAIAAEPRFTEALVAQGNVILNTRLAQKDSKKKTAIIGEALASFETAIDFDSNSATALVARSAAQLALGKADQAKSDANRALKIDGSFPAANYALARAELALKKPQEAAGPARAAVEANPYTNLNYYRTLAETFKQLKRKSDCSATLNAIVAHLEGSKEKALKTEAEQLQKEAKENCG